MPTRNPQAHENVTEMPRRRTKRKRIGHLMPELRRRIPTLFDLTPSDEDLAANLGISRMDLVVAVIRDMRRKPPTNETRANVIEFPARKAAGY